MFLVITTPLIGLIPEGRIKRFVNRRCYIIAFRIMARSLTGVITFYNKQYKPKDGGVCVANHTTPYDVVILSTDNCFSLVSYVYKMSRRFIYYDILCFYAFVLLASQQNQNHWLQYLFDVRNIPF